MYIHFQFHIGWIIAWIKFLDGPVLKQRCTRVAEREKICNNENQALYWKPHASVVLIYGFIR